MHLSLFFGSLSLGLLVFFPSLALASTFEPPNLTASGLGLFSLLIFILAYSLVIAEEKLHLRKSKPVIIAAGIMWVCVAVAYHQRGLTEQVAEILDHNLLEFGKLMLFLLAAMTFINTMDERNVFAALRSWLVSKGFSLYWIFWITGLLAFFISPVADNLTTALLMAAVLIAVAADRPNYIAMGCINIVVAANAGGAWSPFGDITTLMVWQAGIVEFSQFFALLVPSLVNWFVPALIMSFFLDKGHPVATGEVTHIKQGGLVVVVLFILTIAMAVIFHSQFHLPPVLGMMTGLGILKVYGWYLKQQEHHNPANLDEEEPVGRFDIFNQLQRAEWDTLMFFYGVILCVGALGAFGYLALVSEVLYSGNPTVANVIIGLLSAVIDNIPVMFAVLTMQPDMSLGQWLLVTLTAGVGGSLLSIGSAAGVALMGQARGYYTFASHLKWSWAVALGYVLSILAHLWINAELL